MMPEAAKKESIAQRYEKLLEEHIAVSQRLSTISSEFSEYIGHATHIQSSLIARMQSMDVVIDTLKKIAIDALGQKEVIRRLMIAQEDIERGL
ncbi:hypothetical protein [Alcanivorax sp. 1008]|uniref:hypothetical protein n=1 Tax=Alcanivorax sp. 1008 TaxID=2816853 RepID=UPI001DD18C6C|nr:hypothetical protein [Alcanivorax sp. 1008]MCC1496833.1 hypothetical protein [Alcanivorax sp. 1008]